MPISSARKPESPQVYAPSGLSFARFPAPFWSAPDALLYLGDVRACLRRLPARSVHAVVTSPPYWGLRDYGTGQWDGGSADCDHFNVSCGMSDKNTLGRPEQGGMTPQNAANVGRKSQYAGKCGKCGAKRTDMQIGMEPSPDCGTHGQAQCGECFVCSMVGVFRGVHRVLRDDATAWINLGDSFASNSDGHRPGQGKVEGFGANRNGVPRCGLPAGNLVGIPWRVALALQADGWVLRSDVPWVKRSAMPEAVQNRPCKSIEYVFMLTKGDHYFDMDAVRPAALNTGGGACFGKVLNGDTAAEAGSANRRYERPTYTDRAFRNSDLWFQSVDGPHGMVGVDDEIVGLDVTTRGYKGAHFAVFPSGIVSPLILASTSEHGCCASCGDPYRRITSREVADKVSPRMFGKAGNADCDDQQRDVEHVYVETKRATIGWRKTCGCQTDTVAPCVVLDPFVGSGTSVSTALQLGRAGVGIDLSDTYLRENAIPRIEAAIAGDKLKKPTVAVPADVPPPPRRLRG